MTRYVAFDSPALSSGDPGDIVLVRDGFCWPAVLSLGTWTVWRGMWETAAVVALAAVILSGGVALGVVPLNIVWLTAGVGYLLLAFEGYDLRCWTLHRRGYVPVAVVAARSLFQAEQRVACLMREAR